MFYLKRFSLLIACSLLAQPVLAHDFWLVPEASHTQIGETVIVYAQSSSNFPTSLAAVDANRIAFAELVSANGSQTIDQFSVSDKSLQLNILPDKPGQMLVAVKTLSRSIPETPESFRHYLKIEGAPEALVRYEKAGILPTKDITRRYTKYAKTIVEVGANGARNFDKAVGFPVEVIALNDPANTKATDAMKFRLLYKGQPLAQARGHSSVADSADAQTHQLSKPFESDANGEFTVQIDAKGVWNISGLYIAPAEADSGADWDVHWFSLVWWITQ